MNWAYIFSIALLVFGFGFVIFWHELGHFLAAKWVGIRVEQFAVGFGQAILSWRKGMGVQIGSSGKKYAALLEAEKEGIQKADLTRIGETEYRLNWIPLGGYVKMVGQDDLDPNAPSDDPASYKQKSVGARMLVISAGVIMNVILAAVGFMILFLWGFKVPAAAVGGVAPGSPGQLAGLQVGDLIKTYDGKPQHDFTKISLNVALSKADAPVPITVERMVDGQLKSVDLMISPTRMGDDGKGLMVLGIEGPRSLRVPKNLEKALPDAELAQQVLPDTLKMGGGDAIVAVNGRPVRSAEGPVEIEKYFETNDYAIFDRAIQEAMGKPVKLTVRRTSGVEEEIEIQGNFAGHFGGEPTHFLGMATRTLILQVAENSPARGKILPGDVVVEVQTSGSASDSIPNPSSVELRRQLSAAGEAGRSITLKVLRAGAVVEVKDLKTIKLENKQKGLGLVLGSEADKPVVGEILAQTPAERAGIPKSATLVKVGGKAVESWHDVIAVVREQKAGAIPIEYVSEAGATKTVSLAANDDDLKQVAQVRYAHALPLGEAKIIRQTANPAIAAAWGATETRDFILQFYLTLRRMVDGSVSPSNMMGPLGIFHAGSHFAYRGTDWLIWFLAMISANLAVVNFLPIPIVDGGHFMFLIIEKIKGKPVSAKTWTVAQYVGLALLLGIVLFVTYNDIMRL